MDTLSIFFGYDEIQRLKHSLYEKKERSKKRNIFEIIYSKLYNECEKK
jgi:hypothetical protein